MPLTKVPNSFSMPKASEAPFRERLDHLHRRQARLHHQLHFPVLGKTLDKESVRRAAAIGAESDAHATVGQLL